MDIRYTTREHKIPNGQVTLLGAMDRVTGAMTLYQSGSQCLLIDSGKPIGRGGRDWVLPQETLQASALLLTHGHTDHVSALPDLLDAGFEGPIYGTSPTLELAKLNCRDGIRLQGGSTKDIRRFLRKFAEQTQIVYYDRVIKTIHGFDGQVTFHEAGHIIGSSSIDIVSADNRVLLSGDLGRPNSPILRDYNTVYKNQDPIDLIVMESTYGRKEHTRSAKDVENDLERIIKHALRDGGHILVPAFSIGRTQTLLYHINTLVESGRLRNLPVAIDSPLGLKVTEVYQESKKLFDEEAQILLRKGDDPLEFDDLYAVHKASYSARLRDIPEPMLIIAGSGMCTGGRIVGHLQELMPKPETCVLFVGYQAQGTPGRAIQEAARSRGTVHLGGEEVQVNCEITNISGLSAHADRKELKKWLDATPPAKAIALHHGEPASQKAFAEWLNR